MCICIYIYIYISIYISLLWRKKGSLRRRCSVLADATYRRLALRGSATFLSFTQSPPGLQQVHNFSRYQWKSAEVTDPRFT